MSNEGKIIVIQCSNKNSRIFSTLCICIKLRKNEY